jgi:hypothetical protein
MVMEGKNDFEVRIMAERGGRQTNVIKGLIFPYTLLLLCLLSAWCRASSMISLALLLFQLFPVVLNVYEY